VNWLRAIYVFNGLAGAALYSFIPVILKSKGFDPALIGVAMSMGSFVGVVSLPIWGHVGDMLSGPRRALQIAIIPAVVFAFGFSLPLEYWAIIGCQLVVNGTGNSVGSLTDAMALGALRDAPERYSRLRLMTSIGNGGGTLAFGLLYGAIGYNIAPLLYLVAIGGSFVCAHFLPLGRESARTRLATASLEEQAQAAATRHGRFGSTGEALRVNPRLIPVLLTAVIVYMGIMSAHVFISLRLVDLGYGAGGVGVVQGIGFAAEIPAMLAAGWLIARLGARTVMVVSAVAFGFCSLAYAMVDQLWGIVAIRFLIGFCFSGVAISMVLTVARMLPGRLQATGQTLVGASGFGVGSILASLIGGYLYGNLGPWGVFGFGAICLFAGAAMAWFAVGAAVRSIEAGRTRAAESAVELVAEATVAAAASAEGAALLAE
jgi:MFS family permease